MVSFNPSPAQFAAAEQRYLASLKPGDVSDYAMGLRFVMATYTPYVWERFFQADGN